MSVNSLEIIKAYESYVEELENALIDLAFLCYAPPEDFEINGGKGKGVCGTCDLGQDGSREHNPGCGLHLGWQIYQRRQAFERSLTPERE